MSSKEAHKVIEKTKKELKKEVTKIENKAAEDGVSDVEVQSILEKNNKLWEVKMGDALKSFNKRVKDINDKFTKQMDAENKNHEILLAQNESTFKTALDSEDKKIDSL